MSELTEKLKNVDDFRSWSRDRIFTDSDEDEILDAVIGGHSYSAVARAIGSGRQVVINACGRAAIRRLRNAKS